MSKKLEELYEDLEKYKNFDDGDNTEKFLYTLDQIVAFQNPSSIPIIIKYFDDNSDYGWILEIIQGNVLYLLKNAGYKELMKNLRLFINIAQGWASDTCSIIFNDPAYLSLFRKSMNLAPKESLLKLFDLMEKESPHHAAIIKELREEVEKPHT